MRILVVADVHANLVALEAVLVDAANAGYDEIWNLGDTVDYGPWPGDCINLLAELPVRFTLAGNHDAAAVGRIGIEEFNPVAGMASNWTTEQLSTSHKEWLAGLPFRLDLAEGVTLAHGSPRDPIWEYVVTDHAATIAFESTKSCQILVGHSHLPLIALATEGGPAELGLLGAGEVVDLSQGRTLWNPGSIGQPRDGDPRAAWGIIDFEQRRIEQYRTPYDISRVQKEIRRLALPESLARRLEIGR